MNDSSKPISNRPSLKNILKLTAQIGISGSKMMLFVFFTFGFSNLGWTIYAALRLFTQEFSWTNIGVLVLVVLLGVGFTLLACYFTYRYILLLSIKKVYDMTLEQRTKISEDIIRRVESTFKERAELSQAQLGVVVSWSQTVYRYYQAVPVFFQSIRYHPISEPHSDDQLYYRSKRGYYRGESVLGCREIPNSYGQLF